jgi:hypothetical protein
MVEPYLFSLLLPSLYIGFLSIVAGSEFTSSFITMEEVLKEVKTGEGQVDI